MKKFTLSVLFTMLMVFSGLTLLSQAPESMKYQAVLRDAQGDPLTNTAVGVQISILKGSASGNLVFRETHIAVSNQYGIMHFNIGTGSLVSGSFQNINWGIDSYFVEIAADINGGSSYQVLGTSQMLSVPYALYAKTSGNGGSGGDPQCLSVSDTGDTLYISGCNWVIVPGISEANGGGGGGDVVYDWDGNAYNTIVIGQQTWLQQNLRSEHDASGSQITNAWDYNNNPSNSTTYGKLYDWEAIMNGSGASNGNPSGVQGICPNGWHIPSIAEFDQLISHVGGIIGAAWKLKETGTTHWAETTSQVTNETGFSARGAGKRTVVGAFDSLKEATAYWTTSTYNLNSSYNIIMYSNQNGAMTHSDNKEIGFSVRCVKN